MASAVAPDSGPPRWQDQQIDQLASGPAVEAAAVLGTDRVHGLTAAEAAARLAVAGPNEPAASTGPRWPGILLRQFSSVLVLILFAASVVSLLLSEWLNAGVISFTAFVSAGFGFQNEYRSERAIAALRRLTARHAEVVRDGLHEEVAAAALVPGDLLAIGEGSVVPADARVVESRGLLVDESILTGEPEAVPKSEAFTPVDDGATAATALYAGTTVVAGSALAIAVATGARTTLGRIAAAVQGAGRRATPLEGRLAQLGNRLIAIFVVLCVLLVGLGLVQGREPRLVVEMAVSLAIGAVPEGLPAVATAALAVAVRRLAARRVLVRRLDAVETLGSTTVIVTDKTGTLTENRMTVRRVLLAGGEEFAVRTDSAGDADRPRTVIERVDGTPPTPEETAAVERVLLIGALCNDAVVEHDAALGWHAHGDPSEGALALAAAGRGLDGATLAARYPRAGTEPFTSARRMMRTVHHTAAGSDLIAIKGAFEQVAALDPAGHTALAAAVHALGDAGFRVFTVAEADGTEPLHVRGAIVLEDPLRPDAAEAVAACRAAGIRLMLVTGDQIATASNVARRVGILAGGLVAVRGPDLNVGRLERVAVVARATHAQKAAIVDALQQRGEVVAMTGDGVNDAAALRSADVGVAVGPNATDVAIEAAHVLVADGRLYSLVHGIGEGRRITRSLRQAIVYLLTASFGTILVIALSMAANGPLPLTPLQILWLNIVVHVFPALALATSREAGHDTDRPTRALLGNGTWPEIGWRALCSAGGALGALAFGSRMGDSVRHEQTLVFVALAAVLVGQAFLVGVRSLREQPARLRRRALWLAAGVSGTLLLVAVYLPGLQGALGLHGLSARDWAVALGCAALAGNAAQIGAALIGRAAAGR